MKNDASIQVSAAIRDGIAERISVILEEVTQTELGERAGLSQSTIGQYAKGGVDPKIGVLARIAEATGRPLSWLLFGGEKPPAHQGDDFVAVPLLPEAVSAGDGALAEMNDFAVDRLLMFRADWMRGIGVNPKRAHVLRVRGDSMEPTLFEGDVVLCDISETSLAGGGMFVILTEDGPVVKRLERDDDGVVLVVSDNARYRARRVIPPFSESFRIIGRVRWYARTLR